MTARSGPSRRRAGRRFIGCCRRARGRRVASEAIVLDRRGTVLENTRRGPIGGPQFARNVRPVYDYHCTACGADSEILQKISDPPETVGPECGKPKQIARPNRRGKGWPAGKISAVVGTL